MARFIGGLATGLVVAALVAIGLMYLLDLELVDERERERESSSARSSAPSVEMPDVSGMAIGRAEATVEALGLDVRVVERGLPLLTNDPKPYRVVEQVPAAGTEVPLRARATLYAEQ